MGTHTNAITTRCIPNTYRTAMARRPVCDAHPNPIPSAANTHPGAPYTHSISAGHAHTVACGTNTHTITRGHTYTVANSVTAARGNTHRIPKSFTDHHTITSTGHTYTISATRRHDGEEIVRHYASSEADSAANTDTNTGDANRISSTYCWCGEHQ